jgi:hypothetical protein
LYGKFYNKRPVATGLDRFFLRCGPIRTGPKRSGYGPLISGSVYTGCGCQLPRFEVKNRTRLDFKTLIIRAADKHACDECTQRHRKTSDVVDIVFDDPAAVVGVDATDDDIPALVTDHEDPEVDLHEGDEMDVDNIRDTTLVTLDGVVMGPQVNELIIF